MERPSIESDWTIPSDSDSNLYESFRQGKELKSNGDDEKLIPFGFVILTSKRPVSRGKKDTQVVSEWFTGRLNRMNIKPMILSFNETEPESELTDEEEFIPQPKKVRFKPVPTGNKNSKTYPTQNSQQNDPKPLHTFDKDGKPIPVWKLLAKQHPVTQQLNQTVKELERAINTNNNRNRITQSYKGYYSDTTGESSLENSESDGCGKTLSKSKGAGVKETKSKRKTKKAPQKSRARSPKHDKLKLLEETFRAKSSSPEGVWVVIIDSPFRHFAEIDKVEAMGIKYNFRILALNPPFKSNILRLLEDIANQQGKVSKQSSLDAVSVSSRQGMNDCNANCIYHQELVIATGIGYPQSLKKKLSKVDKTGKSILSTPPYDFNQVYGSKWPKDDPILTDPQTDTEEAESDQDAIVAIEEDLGHRRDEITILHSEDTLKSSISSASIKELQAKFGKIRNGLSEDGNYAGAVDSNDSFEEDDDSSRDSKDSSVFEMGEENLLICVKQASKIVIPPPVSPKLFFQNLQPPKSKDSSKRRALVVIIKDSEHERNSNFSLSRALKEKLKRNKIKSYIISISNLMKDLQAIQATKAYVNKISMRDQKLGMTDGYAHLILAVLAEKMITKSKRVVIIDLGDETSLRLWPVKDFCTRSQAQVMTLERLPDETNVMFEDKLSKLSNNIKESFKDFDWSACPYSKETIAEISNQHLATFIPHQQFLDIREATTKSEHEEEEEELSQPSSDLETEPIKDAVLQFPAFVPKLEEEARTTADLEQVRDRLTRHSDTKILAEDDNRNAQTEAIKKTKRYSSKGNLEFSGIPSVKDIKVDSPPRSLYELRRKIPASNSSESSLNSNDLYKQDRTRLLKIQKISDSKAPSTLFSKICDSKTKSLLGIEPIDEDNLYKSWIAVPKEPPTRIQRFVRGTSTLMNRIYKPVRSLLTCQYCTASNDSRIAPTSVRPRQRTRQRHQ